MRLGWNPMIPSLFVLLCVAWGGDSADETRAGKVRELLDLGGEVGAAITGTQALGGVPAERLFLLFPKAGEVYLDILTPIYGRHLDDETLNAALAFFRSPAGQKYRAAVWAATMEWARAEANPNSEETRQLNHVAAMTMCKSYRDAAGRYKATRGKYPQSLDDLAEPVMPSIDLPFAKIRRDPWGHACVLRFTLDGEPTVVCLGPDGVEGTDDDIACP